MDLVTLALAKKFASSGSGSGAGTPGEDGVGIQKIEKTNTEGLVDTYTITLTDSSTYTFTVTNGKDGEDADGNYLPLAGGTMAGNLVMGGYEIYDAIDIEANNSVSGKYLKALKRDETGLVTDVVILNISEPGILSIASNTRADGGVNVILRGLNDPVENDDAATKAYVDSVANSGTGGSVIHMKVIDAGDVNTLIDLDTYFTTDVNTKNTYVVRGALVDASRLQFDMEPVHFRMMGSILHVKTLDGKYFRFLRSSDGSWSIYGETAWAAEDNVLTRNNTEAYIPTNDYNPATKMYVDNSVPKWAKQPTKPSYTADEVVALPVGTKIPAKTSDLTNDSGYLTQIPEEYVTETELGQKGYITEDDIPDKLPSPGTLTFTGAVNDTYDGSTDKTINIPTGGSEGGTSDYSALANKPQLNGVEITGNKTSADYKIVSSEQGAENNGKFLGVGADGNVTPVDKPAYTANEVGARPNTWTPSAEDVGALPNDTEIPSKTSDLENDSGFITGTDIPEKLPNPQKIIFTGAVSAEYDGSSELTVNIPESTGGDSYTLPIMSDTQLGGGKAVERTDEDVPVAVDPSTGQLFVPEYPTVGGITIQTMQNTDTAVTIPGETPYDLYIFPEMADLAVTIADENTDVHFFFDSGATATVFSLQSHDGGQIYTDAYSIDANMRYEVSVLNNVAYIKGVSMNAET